MATKTVPPSWADGLVCPPLTGQDPAQHARELVARVASSVARAGGKGKGGVVSVGVVDHVFVLVRLALDDRPPSSAPESQPSSNPPEAERIFRSSLAPGALGLVPKLVAALQPRQVNDANGGDDVEKVVKGKEDLRNAVVQTAGHLAAMEQLVTRQNNTPALLMAHNGLAKLLKNNWPWLLGGVVDAPRLLCRLCEIYRDGLEQLKVALAQARAKHAASHESSSSVDSGQAPEGAETAHLKKFGKLLATFGTRMACLLRHLGPECSLRDRTEAYRLYAKAAAAAYPGLLACRRAQDEADAGAAAATGADSAAASGGVAGGIIYPKAVEAFLSTTDRPPCCQSADAGPVPDDVTTAEGAEALGEAARMAGRGGAGGKRRTGGGVLRAAPVSCRCYEGSAGPFSGRRHDPWEALEALRPTRRVLAAQTPPPPPSSTSPAGDSTDGRLHNHGEGRVDPGSNVEGGDIDGGGGGGGSGDAWTAADPLGAVLLFCEVLRRSDGRWTSSAEPALPTILRRRERCCAWVLDHLAALFPGWVEVASAATDAGASASAALEHASGRGAAFALCDEVASALGLFVCRRALDGEFQQAQVQLVEGCACHPHPLCREAWIGALKVFLRRCDPAAQETCVRSLSDAALDPRVSRRCRRRLARALAAACAADSAGTASPTGGPAPLLAPAARAVLIESCLSRVRDGREGGGARGGGGSCADGSAGRSGGGGACALDLLRGLPRWFLLAVDDDGELAAASVSFATRAVTACLGGPASGSGEGGFSDGTRIFDAGGAGGDAGSSRESHRAQESFAAAARFLAARFEPAMSGGPHASRVGRGAGDVASGVGESRALAGLEEGARGAGTKLGGLLAAGRLPGGLSGGTLSAIMRLVGKTDAGRLPQLCDLIAKEAHKRAVGGEALLALAEGLSSVGRRQHQRAGDVWKTVIQDGFAVLFASRLWPVTTAAMEALEAVARCVDPSIAQLLPRQIPDNRLVAFKNRLAKRPVCLDGGRPIELAAILERGLKDTRILLATASALSARSASAESSQQVFLKEGSDLSALSGLLTSTVTGVRVLSEQEGRGVCLTLLPAETEYS